jgi:hypothetical protein
VVYEVVWVVLRGGLGSFWPSYPVERREGGVALLPSHGAGAGAGVHARPNSVVTTSATAAAPAAAPAAAVFDSKQPPVSLPVTPLAPLAAAASAPAPAAASGLVAPATATRAHHAEAVQVEFESKTLKPVFHFIGSRV